MSEQSPHSPGKLKPVIARPPGYIEPHNLPLGERFHQWAVGVANHDGYPKDKLTRRQALTRGGATALSLLGLGGVTQRQGIGEFVQKRFLGKPQPTTMIEATPSLEAFNKLPLHELVQGQDTGNFTQLTKFGYTWVDAAGRETQNDQPKIVGVELVPVDLSFGGKEIKFREGISIDANPIMLSEDEAREQIPDLKIAAVRVRGNDKYVHKINGKETDVRFGIVSGQRNADGEIQYVFAKPNGEPIAEDAQPLFFSANFGTVIESLKEE